jgi:histidine triad (HIT) family protein
MDETIFDKILAKKIPAQVVYEDETVLAFKDLHPQAKVHVLVIPKTRAASLQDFAFWSPEATGLFFHSVIKVAKTLGLDQRGYRIVMNTLSDGGQTVAYAHVHILGGEPLSGAFS